MQCTNPTNMPRQKACVRRLGADSSTNDDQLSPNTALSLRDVCAVIGVCACDDCGRCWFGCQAAGVCNHRLLLTTTDGDRLITMTKHRDVLMIC